MVKKKASSWYQEHPLHKKVWKKNNKTEDLMGTGITGMAGMYAVGSMNSLPGMPANNTTGMVSAGANLAAVGGLTNIAMNIIPKTKKGKYKK